MARIPFKATASQTFSLLPKGTYLLRILDVEEKQSKNNQAMLQIKHEIESNDEYNGRTVMRWFMAEGAASFRLRALCETVIPDKVEVVELDEVDEKGNKLSSVDFDTDDLIGQAYYAECIQKYNKERQEDQNEWRKETSVNAAAADAEGGDDEDEEDEEEEEEEQEEPAQVAPKAAPKAAPAAAAGKAAVAPKAAANTKPAAAAPAANTGRARTRMQA